MPSVARSQPIAAHHGAAHAASLRDAVASAAVAPPRARAAGSAPVALPVAVEADRQRAVTAVLDQVRFGVVALVRHVAERLTTRPASVRFGALELEVRDTVLAIGRDLLTELVRLPGPEARATAATRTSARVASGWCSRNWRRCSSGHGSGRLP